MHWDVVLWPETVIGFDPPKVFHVVSFCAKGVEKNIDSK